MKDLEHYLNIHLKTLSGDFNVVGQEDYNYAWRAAVENVLGSIVDEIKKLKK